MKKLKWISGILAVLCCIGIAIQVIRPMLQSPPEKYPPEAYNDQVYGIVGEHEAGSIGIIGGADGPTAVFVTSPYAFLLPPVGLLILGTLLFGGVSLALFLKSKDDE